MRTTITHAGHGGQAGQSADISVLVKESDADLLYLIDEFDNSGSKGGKAGRFGKGGKGGAAGLGGKSLEYYENDDRTKTREKKFIGGGYDGKPGIDGTDGRPGSDGMKSDDRTYTLRVLQDDRIAEYATPFRIGLDHVDPLTSPGGVIEPGQTLTLQGFVLNNTSRMTMPGGGRVQFQIRENPHVAALNGPIALQDPLRSGSIRELKRAEYSLRCRIQRASLPVPNSVFSVETTLGLKATLPRIQRELKSFHPTPMPLVIEYPVEVSVMQTGRTVLAGGKTPIALRIRNNSSRAIGRYAEHARHLRVVLDIERDLPQHMLSNITPVFTSLTRNATLDPATVIPPDAADAAAAAAAAAGGASTKGGTSGDNNDDAAHSGVEKGQDGVRFNFLSPVVHEINYLGPDEELSFEGLLTIRNATPALYQFLHLRCTASIGQYDRPLHLPSMVSVQQEIATVQVAEERQQLSSSDLLLVISSSTTRELVQHWKEIAALLGLGVSVWNVSVYNGFSYDDEACSAVESIPDGLVVFLNIAFFRDDNVRYLDKAYLPIEYLSAEAMFEAARRHGVRTYVVNGPQHGSHTHISTFPKRALPLKPLPVAAGMKFHNRKAMVAALKEEDGFVVDEHLLSESATVMIKKAYLFGKPSQKSMQKKVTELLSTMKGVRPEREHFYASSYHPIKHGCKYGLLRLYELGEAEVRRGLDRTHAAIANRDCFPDIEERDAQGALSDVDLFVTVKLLTFHRKLFLFNTMTSIHTALHRTLGEAIVSDLADEQYIFVKQFERTRAPKAEELMEQMPLIKMFGSFDFSKLCTRSAEGAEKLKTIIIKVPQNCFFFLFAVFCCCCCFFNVGCCLISLHIPPPPFQKIFNKLYEFFLTSNLSTKDWCFDEAL